MTEREVTEIIRRNIAMAGSLRELARQWKVSAALISDVMNRRRSPGPKILDHLNLRRVVRVTYEPYAKLVNGVG
jgi:hypothetical protein